MLVQHFHCELGHAGINGVLNEMRKQFYIAHYFTVVKKEIRKCVICRRYNNLPVKLNQSPYRDFRVDPKKRPFATVMLDYIGPYTIKIGKSREKCYLLIVTCLYTRAVSLQICHKADTASFLRALQMHIFRYGIFRYVSQI